MKILWLFSFIFLYLVGETPGQSKCLSDEEAKSVIASIHTPLLDSANKTLRKELLNMREEREKLNAKISQDFDKNQDQIPAANLLGEKHLLEVCRILKTNGWLTQKVLNEDGFNALMFLITNTVAYHLQREIFPILVEAGKKGSIKKPLLATLVDSIRVGSDLPQIFGTQASIKKDIIYLYPLLNEKKINEWRKIYDLPSLASQIRDLEQRYLLPVLKRQMLSAPSLRSSGNEKQNDTAVLGISGDENEVVTIETELVNLNLRILTRDFQIPDDLKLGKEDFTVLEDDVEQEILFFTETDQPFDLILLLDFSGSTLKKRKLIKNAARRFVEYSRPDDRISVVAFAGEIKVVSDLTTDKAVLIEKIKDLDLTGMSPIWDALQFSYDKILKKERLGRRSAIVFMTDGEDNSQHMTFADLMETVRNGDTTIFSIYLDIKSPGNEWLAKYRRKSRQTLWMLAEESGGEFYKAEDVEDLQGIYRQVINDLGKVYSIGYEPKNDFRDGGWRNLTVRIKNQPHLIVRTRRGYYAR